MDNVKVVEIKQIQVQINMSPDQWDPIRFKKEPDTTVWHKAKLLNQRVAKNAPNMNIFKFYRDLARFADELGYGDSDVLIELTEYLYQVPLDFDALETHDVEQSGTISG